MTHVLTLRLDADSQRSFDALRRRFFPPERNHIAAHVTLFHALPDEAWIEDRLAAAAAGTERFPVSVTGVRSLGKGVAYRLAAAELQALQGDLAAAFAAELSPQDRQRFSPHVVVQNKVTSEAARALLAELEGSFTPWAVRAEGLDLWRYLGGPWEHARTFPFYGAPDASNSAASVRA